MTPISTPTITRRSHGRTWIHRALVPLWKSPERWPVIGSGIGLAVAWGIVVSGYPPGTENVVTHYSIPFGIDGIGSWWQVWLVPSIATVVTVLCVLGMLPVLRHRQPKSIALLHSIAVFCNFGIAWGLFLLRVQQVPV